MHNFPMVGKGAYCGIVFSSLVSLVMATSFDKSTFTDIIILVISNYSVINLMKLGTSVNWA